MQSPGSRARRLTRTRSSAGLGPEPFDPAFDADYLWRETRRRRAAIKLALMDNHLVVGVGNIYANESLFRARIRPTTPVNRVSESAAGWADRGRSFDVVAMRSPKADRRCATTSTAAANPAISSSTPPLWRDGIALPGLRTAIRAIR